MKATNLKRLKEMGFEELERKLKTECFKFVNRANGRVGVKSTTRLVTVVYPSSSLPPSIPLRAWHIWKNFYVVENKRCAKVASDSSQTEANLMRLEYCMFTSDDENLLPRLIHEINQAAQRRPDVQKKR